MRKLTYYIATTLDGFIADPTGGYGFFPEADDMAEFFDSRRPETVPTAIRALAGLDAAANRRFDTVLMGRGTYQISLDAGITCASTSSPARSPTSRPRRWNWSQTTRSGRCAGSNGRRGRPAAAGWRAPCCPRSTNWLVIKHYPVAIGTGLPVFAPHPFDLTGTRTFSDGAAVPTYTRTGQEAPCES